MEDAAQDIAQTGGCEPQRHGMVETTRIRATHGREVQVGQIVQQIRRLGAQAPGTGQPGRGAGLTCLKARQHLQTQEIAGKPRILVAGILNPEQGVLVGVSLKITTGHIQQGPPDGHPASSDIPYAHAPCSPHPRPPQGAKQHGLSLIALMVGQDQACAIGILLQSPMAGLPCSRLEPTRMIAPDHDLPHKKRHAQAVAKLPTPHSPCIRPGNQAVVDMDSGEFEAERLAKTRENMQKNGGIKSATQAEPEAGRRDRKLPPVTDDSRDRLSRRQFP